MPRLLANSERLFSRTWRPRHPLRPRLSIFRRWIMPIVLLLLLAIIVGYVYFPNSKYGRGLAANALSQLLGGKVEIQNAQLSIFDGLRLDGVSLRVDDGDGAQNTLFSAKTFLVHIEPAALLAGQLQIKQIIVIEPTINLAEDAATHLWNYQLLHRPASAASRPSTGFHFEDFPVLPQVAVRGGQVHYLQVRDGQAQPVGSFGMEVPLSPDGQHLHAQLYNLNFGPDIKAVLPADASAWLEQHGLGGQIDNVDIAYTPQLHPGDAGAKVRVAVKDAELTIGPDAWRSRLQIANQKWLQTQVTMALERGWISANLAADLRRLGTPQPIHLRQLNGAFEFSDQGVAIIALNGRIENNWLNVDGRMQGYDADGQFALDVSSLPGHDLEIPPWSCAFVASLPDAVRDICDQFNPNGTCAVHVRLDRAAPGGPINVAGRLDILNGGFMFEDFPYPLHNASGAITISKGDDGKDYVHILDVTGYGMAGSANANTMVTVSGDVGPVNEVAGGNITITGKNVICDQPLRQAMPPDVNDALELFDPPGRGEFPKFNGDFLAKLNRKVGHKGAWKFEVDLDIRDAFGKLVSFPYPLENLAGRLEVHDGFLDIRHAHMQNNGMSADVDGRVFWQDNPGSPAPHDAAGKPMLGPQLTISAHHVPLDANLLGALPPSTADWLKHVGALAVLDVQAKVMPGGMAITSTEAAEAAAPAKPQQDVNYLVDVTFADALAFPSGPSLVLDRLGGRLRITPDAVKFIDITAHRGDTVLSANGDLDLSARQPRLHMQANAKNLAMDDGLYHALSDSARDGWDAMRPQGTLHAALKLDASLNADASSPPADFTLTLTPRDLAITPVPLPYRLDKLQGSLTFSPGLVRVNHLQGSHGPGTVAYDGIGHVDGTGKWDLKIAAHNLEADDDLRHGVPEAMADVLNQVKLKGKLDIDISQLAYRPTTRPSVSTHGDMPDVDVAAKITLHGDRMEAGVPMSDVSGAVALAAIVRGGELSRLEGTIDVPTLQAAGRPATGLKADFAMRADDPAFHVSNLEAAMADGSLTGDIALTYPEKGPSHYDISLFCHDMDIHQMLNNADDKVHGRLTASLTLGGPWNDVKSRRGHGDVRVNGQEMYSVPMMLGAVRWINMGVPSAFTSAIVRYSVDGPIINLERLELSSKDMTMSGTGTLDFGTNRVDLSMVTDNAALLSVPIVGDLIKPAMHELMHIHVGGPIQQPKVSATSFDTITTTVDEVVKREEKK